MFGIFSPLNLTVDLIKERKQNVYFRHVSYQMQMCIILQYVVMCFAQCKFTACSAKISSMRYVRCGL